MTKKEIIAGLKDLIATDDRWALHALAFVYKQQTAQEKLAEATREKNGVGFTGTDGEILTSFAKQYERRGSLSPKQLALLHRRMPCYAGQIVRLNDPEKIAAKLQRLAADRAAAAEVPVEEAEQPCTNLSLYSSS